MSETHAASMRIVLDFMLKENRPYAVDDVMQKCGKDLDKAIVQKALDYLASKDILVAKAYGKHTIYFAKQNTSTSELKQDIKYPILKQKLAQAQYVLNSKETELNEINLKLKSVKQVKTLNALREERDQLLDDIRLMNETLRRHQAQESEAKYSPQDIKRIETTYDRVSLEYRKRKRMCSDLVDAIAEGYPDTKKALIEDIGVETDEEVGFNVLTYRR